MRPFLVCIHDATPWWSRPQARYCVSSPSPSAPPQTGQDTFASSGFPVFSKSDFGFTPCLRDYEDGFGAPHHAYLPIFMVENTCLTLPWRRLSRPPWSVVTPTTTIEAPLP
jgi:hypothetical protein